MKLVREVTLSWGLNKLSLSRLAVAAVLACGVTAASANVLVVRSSGPSAGSYPPGRSLPDNARIALRQGDTLTVLDSRGTRTFRGPGNFNPSVAAQAGGQTVTASNGRIARVGAVRSAGIVPTRPASSIWQVDVEQSGTMCVADTGNVTLWRANDGSAATTTVTGPGGSGEVSWAAGASMASWPAGVPVTAGAEYRLQTTGAPVPATVRFKALQATPSDVSEVAQVLIENGCQEQLDLLVDIVPAE